MATLNSKFKIVDDNSFEEVKSSKNTKKSKYCSKCGYENLITSKFCAECGNDKFYDSLEEYNDVKNSKYCVGCKTKLNIKTKFCPNCGKNEFVNSLDDILDIELRSVSIYWKNKFDEQHKKLYSLDDQIKAANSDIKYIQQEIDSVLKHYNEEVDYLNKNIKSVQVYHSDRSKKLELEHEELLKRQNQINASLKELEESFQQEDKDFKKKIDDITVEINGYKSDNAKLEAEINKVKNTNNFQLKKTDKDHIYIGRYGGKELLWNIINETSTEMLLITNECIDAGCKVMSLSGPKVDSVLDKINKEAFNDDERAYIVGDVTLLSHNQLINYMYFKEKRICGYNKLAGEKANLRNGLISWWLKEDEIVNGKGDVNTTVSTSSCHGIRGVITVKKKK